MGADYVVQLLDRVRRARVVLAVIGRRWLTTADSDGRRRIDDPEDWVRRELAEALMTGVKVVPILVDDAALPLERQLPADIAALARCQYRRLRHREAGTDIARLVGDLVAFDPGLASREGRGPVLMGQLVTVGRHPLLADAFQQRPGLQYALSGIQVNSRATTEALGAALSPDGRWFAAACVEARLVFVLLCPPAKESILW